MERGPPREPPLRGVARVVMSLMRRLAPKHAEAAERESREWFFVCRECGHARSYRELGGIRYKAASRGKRTLTKCPSCGVRRWHSVERRPELAATSEPL